MNRFQIFLMRVILGGIFAFVICRIFRPTAGLPAIIGLGILLVGIAYGLEYFRNKKS